MAVRRKPWWLMLTLCLLAVCLLAMVPLLAPAQTQPPQTRWAQSLLPQSHLAQTQFAQRPATVLLLAQLPATVGVFWTVQGLQLPPSEDPSTTAHVLVLQSRWVLAAGHAARYECRLEGNPGGERQLIALRTAGDPSAVPSADPLLPLLLASFLPPPPTTHLSLLRSFIPQRGQHFQDDGVLILSAAPVNPTVNPPVNPEPSTLVIRVVVI